jgi:hypothetical protein
MPAGGKGQFQQRPKSKTPAERAVEFDAVQAQLKADAAARRDKDKASTRSSSARKA